jgi:hypothetical protein
MVRLYARQLRWQVWTEVRWDLQREVKDANTQIEL